MNNSYFERYIDEGIRKCKKIEKIRLNTIDI